LISLEAKLIDIEEAQRLLDYWQDILGLREWQIKIFISKEADMPLEDAQGACGVIEAIRSATIYILHPDDFDGHHPFNMEQIIIHELLHCKLNSFTLDFKRKSKKYMQYEQEVDALATILYNMNKKAEEKDEIKESRKIGKPKG
jgi:hypothetical protein